MKSLAITDMKLENISPNKDLINRFQLIVEPTNKFNLGQTTALAKRVLNATQLSLYPVNLHAPQNNSFFENLCSSEELMHVYTAIFEKFIVTAHAPTARRLAAPTARSSSELFSC